jgi:hypothetical protein
MKASNMYAERNSPQNNNTSHQLNGTHDIASNHHADQQPVRCANCDIDIFWAPTIVQGKTYCCTGCAAGGPCNCDYSQLPSSVAREAHFNN